MQKPTRLMIFVIGISLLVLSTGIGSGQNVGPLDDRITKTNLIRALRILKPQDPQGAIIKTIRRLGVDFETTKVIESELRKAGATHDLIKAVRESYRQPPGPSPTPSVSPTPPPEPNRTVIVTSPANRRIEIIPMVLVRPGDFIMGSETVSSDERPVHPVAVRGFYMGIHEVTIAEWQVVMKNVPKRMSTFKPEFRNSEKQPVVGVSWNEAQRFIGELNKLRDGYTYGLPTEAEWEYACRAETQGDLLGNLDRMAWYHGNSSYRTHEVGKTEANGFGLFDMLGNAYEWCNDAYHQSYIGAPTDGSSWSSGDKSGYAVLRGGSWRKGAAETSCVVRRSGKITHESDGMGLRVVAIPN